MSDYGPTEPLPGKGDTRCNRTACQVELRVGQRFWNTVTRAYYCPSCARRINEMSVICILTESKP
jgi:hypothetical protein